MVEKALEQLSEKAIIEMDDERKAAMVSNLMVVLCSDKDASPIVNTSGTHPKEQIEPDRDPFWRIGRYFCNCSFNKQAAWNTSPPDIGSSPESPFPSLHQGDRLELPKGHQHPQSALQRGVYIHTGIPGRLFS